jgi:hypothetical protein
MCRTIVLKSLRSSSAIVSSSEIMALSSHLVETWNFILHGGYGTSVPFFFTQPYICPSLWHTPILGRPMASAMMVFFCSLVMVLNDYLSLFLNLFARLNLRPELFRFGKERKKTTDMNPDMIHENPSNKLNSSSQLNCKFALNKAYKQYREKIPVITPAMV